ncbi:mitochondrial inner membrane protein cox18 [Plakobranchus ocellatus]|uniref:Mitochondrial inner membrane protein cox18 n=1 Tax=Plakobranchus ocellatus TaxID=259542 RepID=A0AAV3YCJ9_9GAST|nr:mitochondrial inner membrane protein cox18 [Plakobranchus ocellatus]
MKNTASFWLQMPIWISISYSLRNMTSRALSPDLDHHEECKGLTDEGTLWFSDLTINDSTWILPVMMGCVTLFNIEMTHLTIGEVTKYRKRLTLFLRCLALLFIPISSTMPTAMVFYWVNSGFLAAAQNMLNDYSPFRRFVGLGQSQTESTSPLKALMRKAKLKYFNR